MKSSRVAAWLLLEIIYVFAFAGHGRAFYGGPTGFVVLTDAIGLSGVSSFAFTPDGRILYCERTTGDVRVIEDGDVLPGAHVSVPNFVAAPVGEMGLLGIAVDPDFQEPGQSYIYVYYTQEAPRVNRVVRYLETGGEVLGAPEAVLDDIPAGTRHNGGVLAFGPDKTLFIQTGDTVQTGLPGYGQLAQDLESLAGKVLRVRRDG
ncbi:MAG: PQQ-dependent sugar dehydrogenase, partial [Candidatus Methylomirabilis sp.]|nr:PQQ-dependent sugar dehydrogenase [Deltaproteobacteria bacterium]